MATTPPPEIVLVPSTPRYGAGFDTHGRDPVRRSERLASQRLSRTDYSSPGSDFPELEIETRSLEDETSRPHGRTGGDGTLSRRASSRRPPQRKQRKVTVSAEDVRSQRLHSRTKDQHVNPSSLSTSRPSHNNGEPVKHSTKLTAGMLPTPAKTPRKKTVLDAGRVSRSLFTNPTSDALDSEELLPKKGKKFSHFSLESFSTDLGERSDQPAIEVYTDSCDRIPKKNKDMENPFWSSQEPMDGVEYTDRPKRDKEVEAAVRRNDGMFYVFRGKRIFRKFKPEADDDYDPSDLGLLASRRDLLDESAVHVRPLTRSSIKPRILFPTAEQTAAQAARREAESVAYNKLVGEGMQMGMDSNHEMGSSRPFAVVNSIFDNPSTPPGRDINVTTPPPLFGGRSLRSRSRKEPEPPVTPKAEGESQQSPFDHWTRTKRPSTPANTKKRAASSVGSHTGHEHKKVRETRRTMT